MCQHSIGLVQVIANTTCTRTHVSIDIFPGLPMQTIFFYSRNRFVPLCVPFVTEQKQHRIIFLFLFPKVFEFGSLEYLKSNCEKVFYFCVCDSERLFGSFYLAHAYIASPLTVPPTDAWICGYKNWWRLYVCNIQWVYSFLVAVLYIVCFIESSFLIFRDIFASFSISQIVPRAPYSF